MTTTMTNFRIDKNLKGEMEEICKNKGLTLTASFNVFARKLVMEKGTYKVLFLYCYFEDFIV